MGKEASVRQYVRVAIVLLILQMNTKCLDADSVHTTTIVLWAS